MQHPPSIKRFDIFYLASLGVYAAGFFLGFDEQVAQVREQYAAAGVAINPGGILTGSFVFGMLIGLALWWFVSNRGSNVARWIIAAFLALGLLNLVYGIASGVFGGLTLSLGFTIAATVLSAVAVYYLFQPDANAWFDRERSER
jgi:hypothetical protein